LATVLAQQHDVVVWAREPEVVDSINERHVNARYQSDLELPHNIRATGDLRAAMADAGLVTVVVPSQFVRGVMREVADDVPIGVPIVSASKGIENKTLATMEEVLTDVLPRAVHGELAFLSGPSFARETIQQMATAVTVAARVPKVAAEVQAAFSTPYFRCYTTEDVVGVELGGALKNVVAIAAGAADGLGLGHNSRAALMTRALAEIGRLAQHLGANPLTLSGLAGMGDLVLTCTGGLSRNRHVGVQIGKGRTLQEIIDEMHQVAEGVRTAESVYQLAVRAGVEMPICAEVYRMLYEDKPPAQAVADLMGRQLKAERG
jgi:glycerol-3-phosphate dehydrogenase (NAD(P)+)